MKIEDKLSLQILIAMAKGPLTLLRRIFNASICRRRSLDDGELEQAFSQELCTKHRISHDHSDDTGRSTDASGEEQVADSFDGSDSESSDVMPNSEPTSGSSDGSDEESSSSSSPARRRIRARHPLLHAGSSRGSSCTPLNPDAAVFVPRTTAFEPSLQPAQVQAYPNDALKLRETVRALISALEQWEATDAAEDYFQCWQDQSGPDSTVLHATSDVVRNALASLPPDAAAMVRALVDSKLSAETG